MSFSYRGPCSSSYVIDAFTLFIILFTHFSPSRPRMRISTRFQDVFFYIFAPWTLQLLGAAAAGDREGGSDSLKGCRFQSLKHDVVPFLIRRQFLPQETLLHQGSLLLALSRSASIYMFTFILFLCLVFSHSSLPTSLSYFPPRSVCTKISSSSHTHCAHDL